MATPEQNRWYARGYAAGSRNRWPDHLPPMPPDEVTRAIMVAARALCDKADGLQATFAEDDDVFEPLRTAIEDFNESMAMVTDWIRKDG